MTLTNQLFEYALFKLLQEVFAGRNWAVHYQKPQKYLDKYQSRFLLKPDITVSEGSKIKLIVDAKYKNPVEDSSVNISQSDVYQMLAYAVRYECDDLFLVYPRFKDSKHFNNPLVSNNIDIHGRTIQLHVLDIDITENNLDDLINRLLQDIELSLGQRNFNTIKIS